MLGEVSSLEHEAGDDSVEDCVSIAEALLASAESSEVLGSLGTDFSVELDGDSAEGLAICGDFEEALGVVWVRHGRYLNYF